MRQLGVAQGSGRDAFLFVPPTYDKSKPSPLLVVLHGAGKSAADALALLSPADLDLLKRQRALILTPQSRGATWDLISSDTFRQDLPAIAAALQKVLGSYATDRHRTALLGFSDGATYALSIGLGGPRVFSHIIALSPGGVAPPNSRVVAPAPKVFVAHGTKDTLFPIDKTSRKIVPQLKTLLPAGGDVRYVEFPGAHEAPADVVKQALEWLFSS